MNPESLVHIHQPEAGPRRGIRAGVFGATGTSGVELISLLRGHPSVRIAFATSRSSAGRSLDEIDPRAYPEPLVHPDDVDPADVDVAFLCVPHGTAGELAERCLDAGARVIDLSGDHRLKSRARHEEVYGSQRSESVATRAVYGLTEMSRKAIAASRMVANPGCYATAAALSLAPLAEADLLAGLPVIDAKSGISGAGREPTPTTHFGAVADDVRPYAAGRCHRHVAEIEQTLRDASPEGESVRVVFTPHVVPMYRGIEATIVVPLDGATPTDVREALERRYSGEPFVRVLASPRLARVLGVAGTNRADVAVSAVDGVEAVVVTVAIDNLIKGAGGQAIQNMNAMLALPETLGLQRGVTTRTTRSTT